MSETRKKLSPKEKLEILEYKKEYPTTSDTRIAEIFSSRFSKSICRRSIKNFVDNEKSIREAYIQNSTALNLPRAFKYPMLDKILKEWVDFVEGQSGFLTEKILKTKAISIYNKLENHGNFKASNGWLHKFKKRHNISYKKCSGEGYEIEKQTYDDLFLFIKNKINQMEKIMFTIAMRQLFFTN
ncbi:Major centromere autoantigen B [Dictyocoela muelleri]|nr:Major centromere autoantigen B [Dictyocoela muelleri]